MCKTKCAGGLATCNPAGCSNAPRETTLEPVFALTLRRDGKGQAPVSQTDFPPVAPNPVLRHVVSMGDPSRSIPALRPEAFAQARHHRMSHTVDNAIRYEVHVAPNPLVWGTELELRMAGSEKVLIERFAQALADTGSYGLVLLEAYRGDSQDLILGKVVTPTPVPIPGGLTVTGRTNKRERMERGEPALSIPTNQN